MLELVDSLDLKSSERKLVRVRVPPRAFRPRGGTVPKNTEREAQQYFSRSRFLASDKNGGRVAEMEYAQGLEPCS